MSTGVLLLVLTLGGIAACVSLLLWESRQWVAFDGAPAQRPAGLLLTAGILRRAGIRTRIQNKVALASQATIGVGMSTTLLVHKSDLAKARRVVRNASGSSTETLGQ